MNAVEESNEEVTIEYNRNILKTETKLSTQGIRPVDLSHTDRNTKLAKTMEISIKPNKLK